MYTVCSNFPHVQSLTWQVVDNKINAPKEVLAIEYKNTQEAEARPPSPPPPEPVKVEAPIAEPPDLLVVLIILIFLFSLEYWHAVVLKSFGLLCLFKVSLFMLSFVARV